jgi:hypothetical protein
VGKHRRISAASSVRSAAATQVRVGERTSRVGRAAVGASFGARCVRATPRARGERWLVSLPAAVGGGTRLTASMLSPIGRPVDPSPRAVKGAMAQAPLRALWPPRRRGAGGSVIACAAAPISLHWSCIHATPRGSSRQPTPAGDRPVEAASGCVSCVLNFFCQGQGTGTHRKVAK